MCQTIRDGVGVFEEVLKVSHIQFSYPGLFYSCSKLFISTPFPIGSKIKRRRQEKSTLQQDHDSVDDRKTVQELSNEEKTFLRE